MHNELKMNKMLEVDACFSMLSRMRSDYRRGLDW
jgi:hypothetical protein